MKDFGISPARPHLHSEDADAASTLKMSE